MVVYMSNLRRYVQTKVFFLKYCFHFQLAQWEKYIVSVENTASNISIPVIRRYLRIRKGENWRELSVPEEIPQVHADLLHAIREAIQPIQKFTHSFSVKVTASPLNSHTAFHKILQIYCA